ncbi:MAG: 6-carboxytetrahydropterin synthase QueD [Deltaproteobacteria bacterium]|nr:MAG: 6-carboxytetrahydropterin synthase QueD [Deltaproteobacteria bacterium]
MYEVVVYTYFSAAHNLRGYRGKCEELHGHNWKVSVKVGAEKLDQLGMVIDFKELKKTVNKVIQKLDHKYLNDVPPFDSINPSSENIAYYIFQELKKAINSGRIKVIKVSVWESEDSTATYLE